MPAAITYLDHITAAQTILDDITGHANPHLIAAVAQAHATLAVALLLEENLAAAPPDNESTTTYQTVRIIGGLGPNPIRH